MKFKSKWIYNCGMGKQGAAVSCDYNIENDNLFFSFLCSFANFKSVLLKLDLNTRECQTIFEEKHIIRTAGIKENGVNYLTSIKGNAYCISDTGEKICETILGDDHKASFKMALDEACFYASNRDIFCLDKNTGKILWETKNYHVGNCNILLKDNYLYSAESKGKLFCLDKNTGKTIWEFSDIDWITNIELITDNTFLVTASNNLIYIFKGKDGKRVEKVYEIKANGKLYVKPKIEGNRLYIGDENVPVDSTEGNLTCYEMDKHDSLKEIYKFHVVGGVSSNILIDGNNLYFGTELGYVYCIDKITGEELISKKKCKGTVRNVILYNQDLIALSDKGQVECFEII